ncbi:hypothetical protein N7470_001649 [Penicillium chermesinum]|nr:hypothetical protein N7470_001649 [Penicillium chermesinum]
MDARKATSAFRGGGIEGKLGVASSEVTVMNEDEIMPMEGAGSYAVPLATHEALRFVYSAGEPPILRFDKRRTQWLSGEAANGPEPSRGCSMDQQRADKVPFNPFGILGLETALGPARAT